MKWSRLSLCAKITLFSLIFFTFLTLILMCLCMQRNQADFKYSQIACLHFSVYCSETEISRRQKKSGLCECTSFFWAEKVIFLT